MKNLLKTLGSCLVISAAAKASVTLNGIAFLNAPGISVGDVGYFLVDVNGSGFDKFSFDAGVDLTTSASFGDFFMLGSKTASAAGPNTILSGAFANIALADGVTTGDRFAVVVFGSSTTSAVGLDTFTVWTDPTWVIPADGSTLSYSATPTGANFKQLNAASSPISSGIVVDNAIPEPSSFAAFAGLAVLGAVATRRRRSA